MKITYMLESKDMAAYVGDYLRTTQDGKRQVLHRTLAPAVTCCALLAFFGLFRREYDLVFMAAILFPLGFFLARIAVLKGWQRNAAKYSLAHPELLGTREIEITPDILIHRVNECESRIPIEKVHSVANANTIIVINLGATQAYIVPKRHLTEEQIAILLKLKENPNKVSEPTSLRSEAQH